MSMRLLAPIVACILIRLGLMLVAAPWLPETQARLVDENDPREYHRIALNISRGVGFMQYEPDEIKDVGTLPWAYPGEPEALWPPGYPMLVALCYTLFGAQATSVILIQIIVAGLGCWFLIRGVEVLWGQRVGIVAGWLFATEPISIQISNNLWSEAIFTPMLAVFVYLLAHIFVADNHKRFWWLVAAGAWLGVASYIRVTTFPMIGGLVVATFLWLWARERRLLQASTAAAVLTISFLLVITPWLWRNYTLFGRWAFSTASAYNLLEGLEYGRSGGELFRLAYQRALQRGETPEKLNPFQRADYWRETAIQVFLEDPVGNLVRSGKRIVVAMTTPASAGWGELLGIPVPITQTDRLSWTEILGAFFSKVRTAPGMIGLVSTFYTALFYLLFAFAIISIGKISGTEKSKAFAVTAILLALLTVMTLVNNVHPRSRLPFVTLTTPIVAAGIVFASDWIQSRSKQRRV